MAEVKFPDGSVREVPGFGMVDLRDGAPLTRISNHDKQVLALRLMQAAIMRGLEELGQPDGPIADGLRKVLFVDLPEDLWVER